MRSGHSSFILNAFIYTRRIFGCNNSASSIAIVFPPFVGGLYIEENHFGAWRSGCCWFGCYKKCFRNCAGIIWSWSIWFIFAVRNREGVSWEELMIDCLIYCRNFVIFRHSKFLFSALIFEFHLNWLIDWLIDLLVSLQIIVFFAFISGI